MSAQKLARKSAKHAVWLLIAFVTGGAWIMYFKDAPTLVSEFFVGESSLTIYFFTGLFTAPTYLLAGMAREQFCTYMCPWPRFQSALLDEESLVVTYRNWRGEPRGKHKKGDSWEGRGDCIDCRQCVAVCPTGIDIRDGLQLECIGCGLCIDACDEVMDKVERPRGLIAFETERNRIAGIAGQPRLPYRLIRPRTIVYVALIALVGALMLATLATRATLDINVLHERNPIFVTLSDGSIRNGYTIKILNKTRAPRSFELVLEGQPEARFNVVGQDANQARSALLGAQPDRVETYRVYVELPRGAVTSDTLSLDFVLTDSDTGEAARHSAVFRGPKA